MSKPEDISQEAWDAAKRALNTEPKPGQAVTVEGYPFFIEVFARAIMAATLAEREACALVLDGAADRQREAWDEYITSGGKGPATSFESIFRGQADAIRKRGEP